MIATVDGNVCDLRADALAKTFVGAGVEEDLGRCRIEGAAGVSPARAPIRPLEDDDCYWLLVGRSLSDPTDLAYYLCYGPGRTRCVSWPGWLAPVGLSKRPSRSPRARSA